MSESIFAKHWMCGVHGRYFMGDDAERRFVEHVRISHGRGSVVSRDWPHRVWSNPEAANLAHDNEVAQRHPHPDWREFQELSWKHKLDQALATDPQATFRQWHQDSSMASYSLGFGAREDGQYGCPHPEGEQHVLDLAAIVKEIQDGDEVWTQASTTGLACTLCWTLYRQTGERGGR